MHVCVKWGEVAVVTMLQFQGVVVGAVLRTCLCCVSVLCEAFWTNKPVSMPGKSCFVWWCLSISSCLCGGVHDFKRRFKKKKKKKKEAESMRFNVHLNLQQVLLCVLKWDVHRSCISVCPCLVLTWLHSHLCFCDGTVWEWRHLHCLLDLQMCSFVTLNPQLERKQTRSCAMLIQTSVRSKGARKLGNCRVCFLVSD